MPARASPCSAVRAPDRRPQRRSSAAQAAVDVAGAQHFQRLLQVVGRACIRRSRLERGQVDGAQLLRAIALDPGHALAIDVPQHPRGVLVGRVERQHAQHRLRGAVVVARLERGVAGLQLIAHALTDCRVHGVLFRAVRRLPRRQKHDDLPLHGGGSEVAFLPRLLREPPMAGNRLRAHVLGRACAWRFLRRRGVDRRLCACRQQRQHGERQPAAQPRKRAQRGAACAKVASFVRNTSMLSPPNTMLRRSMNG